MNRKAGAAVLAAASLAGLIVGAAARVALRLWLVMLAIFAAAVGASAYAARRRPRRPETPATSS